MNLSDYLLPQEGLDWSRILSPWGRLLPDEVTVWFANRFGEPFLVTQEGAVHRLNVELGELERLAESREDFALRVDGVGVAQDWFMTPMVDAAEQAGLKLEAGQCFGFAVPTVLGGAYDVENVRVKSMAEYHAFLAALHDKIKDLPDGTEIQLHFEDEDEDQAPR